jgi:ABC transport system ATP-binding/permease protein
MNILSAQGLTKAHGLKQLFAGLTFGMEDRDRVGLIGVNGCGKSTLLRILAGVEPADAGTVTLRQGLRVEHVTQNPVFGPGQSVIECVFSSSARIAPLVREYETACAALSHAPHDPALLKHCDDVSRRMDAASAWDYEHQARTILGKLGVDDMEARVDELSGGYRRRVALAHALLAECDLLVLDEPTNHLDADTVAWLEDHLRRFNGAVLLVTHDRYFLDRVTGRIAELDAGQLRLFEGGFSSFVERKAELDSAAAAQQDRRRAILRTEMEWLKRGAKARTTKQKARIDRIHEMQQAPVRAAREAVAFALETRRLGGKILELDRVEKSLGGRRLIANFTHTFRPGERLGIIGPNGSGKTTLANLMVSRIQPDSGAIAVGKTVAFGYFDQESTELDPDERALDYVKREGGDMLRGTDGSAMSAALVMEQFLFTPQMLYSTIGRLSGGERRRLYLVRTLMRNPNFLILDEPANDLDIPTLQALEYFLDGFGGCLVVISHDRYFLDRTVDHILSFEPDGTLRSYPGGYSAYASMRSEPEPEQTAKRPVRGDAPPREPAAKPAKLAYHEVRELAKLEADIPRMEARLAELEPLMIEAATEYLRLQELADEQKRLAADLEAAMERWAQLAERA